MALGMEATGVMGVPFSTTRTTLFLRFERGSFFLAFILAYISWLNFVVIFAKEKHLSLKKKRKKKEFGQTKQTLNFFFNLNSMRVEGGRLWTKAVTSQSSRIDQIIEVVNRLSVLSGSIDALLVPALELWTLLNCTDATNKEVSNKPREKKKEKGLAKRRRT